MALGLLNSQKLQLSVQDGVHVPPHEAPPSFPEDSSVVMAYGGGRNVFSSGVVAGKVALFLSHAALVKNIGSL